MKSNNNCALLFGPLKDINETFEYIVDKAKENLDGLVDYVEWVCPWKAWQRQRRSDAPRLPPKLWPFTHPHCLADEQCSGRLALQISKAATIHHPSI